MPPPQVAKPEGRRRAADKSSYLDRETLIVAAAELADRDGWLQLTLSDAARAVDRHVTSLYGHVDGLNGLRREITLLALRELADELWSAALGRTGAEGLAAVMNVYRTYLQQHPGRSEALIHADRNDAEVKALGAHAVEPIYATLRSFDLPEQALPPAHHLLSASVRGFGAAEAAGAFGTPAEADATFRQLYQLFLDALAGGAWPAIDEVEQGPSESVPVL